MSLQSAFDSMENKVWSFEVPVKKEKATSSGKSSSAAHRSPVKMNKKARVEIESKESVYIKQEKLLAPPQAPLSPPPAMATRRTPLSSPAVVVETKTSAGTSSSSSVGTGEAANILVGLQADSAEDKHKQKVRLMPESARKRLAYEIWVKHILDEHYLMHPDKQGKQVNYPFEALENQEAVIKNAAHLEDIGVDDADDTLSSHKGKGKGKGKKKGNK